MPSSLDTALIQASEDRFWLKANVGSANECWEWKAARFRKGYGMIKIGRKCEGAHRVSVVLSGRDIPDGQCVDHLCRNRACVNPAHLEVVSTGENNRRGHWTKLSEKDAKEILRSEESIASLARKLGVSQTTVSDVRKGKTWGHVNASDHNVLGAHHG